MSTFAINGDGLRSSSAPLPFYISQLIDVEIMFENQEITIPCKKCGRQHKKTIAWIKSHNGGKISCSCGTDLVIESGQFTRQIDEMEKQLKNLFKKH